VLAIESRKRVRAQPARLRDLSTIESHALFTEPGAFATALDRDPKAEMQGRGV
jgi:hypothetical protein